MIFRQLQYYSGSCDMLALYILCYEFTSYTDIKTRTYIYYYYYYSGFTSGAGTAYLSGANEFIPVFSGVLVTRSSTLCECFVDRCLSLCSFSFDHCIVSPASILITLLVSSNYSTNSQEISKLVFFSYQRNKSQSFPLILKSLRFDLS